MQLDPEAMAPVINRLKRAQGQLAGVLRMVEEGRDCEAVVTQLAAVSKALNRAGFAIVATGMKQCLRDEAADDVPAAPGVSPSASGPGTDVQKMEKLFLSLA